MDQNVLAGVPRIRLIWLLVAALALAQGNASFQRSAWGQWSSDSFEGGQPRWLLVDSDCNAQLTGQEISLLFPHGGQTCELLELACGHGTMAVLAYPIEPSAVIEEFEPRLWTRCSSGGIQLGVRVVFPFAAHPDTGGRLSAVVWGTAYSKSGQWQMLKVDALEERVQHEIVALRKRFGSQLRLEGSFIDSLVVNAYTGPGRYRLQLDDLELRGMVSMAATGNPPPANWREAWRWVTAPVSEEERYWARPNVPAIWIQHRGEQLSWLKSLGFTGLVVDQLPSPEQLREAARIDLDVISPPPVYPVAFPPQALSALKGWMIGSALDSRQTDLARHQAERVAGLPVAMHKPLIAEAMEDFFKFSRLADEVIVPQPLPSSAGNSVEKIEWLSKRLETTKQRSNGWVSISLGVPPSLTEQFETASEIVTPEASRDHLSVDPLGFRQQVVSALLSGAKGMMVRTFRPLDLQNMSDSAQLAALRWVQNDLRLWGPWLVSGQIVEPPVLNSPDWLCGAWRISDSQLLIAQTSVEGNQACIPDTFDRPLEFGMPVSSTGQQVFRLTSGSLERIRTERSTAGIKWTVENPSPIESFIVTSNPRVINFARAHMASVASQNTADQAEIVSHNLRLAANLVAARHSPDGAADPNEIAHVRILDTAQRQIDGALQALRSEQFLAAGNMLNQASNSVQQVLFDGYSSARSSLASPQSSPFVMTAAALPLHWRVANACERAVWQAVELPGSDFSNLNGMLQAGWTQERRLEDEVDLRVELIPRLTSQSSMSPLNRSKPHAATAETSSSQNADDNSKQPTAGLRMAAYSSHGLPVPGGFEGASLRVRSAAMQVQAGQLIRVSAIARILHSDSQPGSGLLVFDNQLGQAMGQLVRGQPTEAVPVELYRFAVRDGEFRLLAECRGECDIVLESVRLNVIQPATNRTSFPTHPLDSWLLDEISRGN